jgi:hypothetical protein
VIEYAVRYLKVKHVVVSGHTGCGGIAAAQGNTRVGGVLDVWLAPLRGLRMQHEGELKAMGEKEKAVRLVELNVERGVRVMREKDVVLEAARDRGLSVHGVVYEVGTGALRELDVTEDKGVEGKRREAFELSWNLTFGTWKLGRYLTVDVLTECPRAACGVRVMRALQSGRLEGKIAIPSGVNKCRERLGIPWFGYNIYYIPPLYVFVNINTQISF